MSARRFNFHALCKQLVSLSGQDETRLDTNDFSSPEALDWTRWIEPDDINFIGGGSYGDVFKAKWTNLPETFAADIGTMPVVVIKVIRVPQLQNDKAQRRYKQLRREITVWKHLVHPNIVPFVGIAKARGALPSLISLWMSNGTVRVYLENNQDVCRTTIMRDIASGLKYLHHFTPQIIHGDLKADNVLVDQDGNPVLVDFGLSRMMEDHTLWATSATSAPGTTRWKAPELLSGEVSTVTSEGDIYAYAMTCFELVTGGLPFSHCKNDAAVITAVLLNNARPERPANVLEDLWTLWCSCWTAAAIDRPVIAVVHTFLDRLANVTGKKASLSAELAFVGTRMDIPVEDPLTRSSLSDYEPLNNLSASAWRGTYTDSLSPELQTVSLPGYRASKRRKKDFNHVSAVPEGSKDHRPLTRGTACLNCRKMKIKCDRVKPACGQCVRGRRECAWRESTSRRAAVTRSSSEHYTDIFAVPRPRHVSPALSSSSYGTAQSGPSSAIDSSEGGDYPPFGDDYVSGMRRRRSLGSKPPLTDSQHQALNQLFARNQYPDFSTRSKLGERIGLTSQRVSSWFRDARVRGQSSQASPSGATSSRYSRETSLPAMDKTQEGIQSPSSFGWGGSRPYDSWNTETPLFRRATSTSTDADTSFGGWQAFNISSPVLSPTARALRHVTSLPQVISTNPSPSFMRASVTPELASPENPAMPLFPDGKHQSYMDPMSGVQSAPRPGLKRGRRPRSRSLPPPPKVSSLDESD